MIHNIKKNKQTNEKTKDRTNKRKREYHISYVDFTTSRKDLRVKVFWINSYARYTYYVTGRSVWTKFIQINSNFIVIENWRKRLKIHILGPYKHLAINILLSLLV